MAVDPLLLESASTQARLMATKKVLPSELLREQLSAIARLNPLINAFVQVLTPEPAHSDAGSPLAGTAFAVKDNIDVAGLPSHSGLRALHAQPAQRDASVVARLKAAGLACLGKLNMHAVALGATNHNADFGNCYNPVRTTHTPGGSSGGSAAAVAAGLCGVALGTDTMGSVRVPASYCGVVGFKPGFDALPVDGVMPLSQLLDHVGILARSVEDVVHAFQAMTVPRAGAHRTAGRVASNAYEFAAPANLDQLGVDPEVRAAFEAGLARLREQGFTLHPVVIAHELFSPARRAGLLIGEAGLRNTLATVLEHRRDEMPADLLAMIDYAGTRSATDLARALATVVSAGQWLTRTIEPFDGLLLPTTPQTAFPMAGPVPHNQADLTAMANMSGAPAISLPLPVPAGELPIGLQLVGRRGQDLELLEAATRAETALR
ncbi:amidase [Caenimonas soli]|uniref:amidase n=1 Tax=Caenimonas soli TaxID=2735555 RepID=UPI001553151F|nr:amidase [Caenimonas soli]NPC56956.1 amidase [Caenimonas soli]